MNYRYLLYHTNQNIETIKEAYDNGIRPIHLSYVSWIVRLTQNEYGKTFNEKLYNSIFIDVNRKCLECGTDTKFYERNFIRGYAQFCGCSCRAKYNKSFKNAYLNDEISSKTKNSIKMAYLNKSEDDKNIIKSKIRKTIEEKYSPGELGNIISRNIIGEEKYNLLSYEFLYDEYVLKKKGIIIIANEVGVSDTVIYSALRRHNIEKRIGKNSTQIENFIEEWLKLNEINYIKNDRKSLKEFEIDFYCPEYNIGIELCGLYWHSIDNKLLSGSRTDKNYHQNKFLLAKSKNIKLITIFEDEILNKPDIVKNRLLYQFKKNLNKIYARKCKLLDIDKETAKLFLQKYHIQSSKTGSINKGLYFENDLVAVATFNSPRYNKEYNLELLRFCTKNCAVVGGLSKIMKNLNCNKIISYSCNRWGNGVGYSKSGFVDLGITPVSYYYFKPTENNKRYHRTQFQKHKISNETNKHLTEFQIMKENGYMKIYDCGNTKWEYNNENR